MAQDSPRDARPQAPSPPPTAEPPIPNQTPTLPAAQETQQPAASSEQPQQQKKPKERPATVADAWRTVKAADFLSVHEAPCARQGFLTGIGGGAAVGFLRFVLGAPVPRAANWAVGAGMGAAVVQYEFCQYRRRAEREKIKRVVEVYDRKQAEVRQKEQEKRREEAARAAEEARLKAQRRWYQFW